MIGINKGQSTLHNSLIVLLIGFFVGVVPSGTAHSEMKDGEVLSLKMAIEAAQANDPWLVGNRHTQEAIESMSISSGTLPDPKISLGLANLPTDTFDFNQEPMTQVKIGISQMFPRGDSLEIKQKQLKIMGSSYPFQREERKANVVVMVGKLWLDAYKAQESIALIENDRPLFEQLADVAEASYSTALGKTRQQDIIRAQLELTRLDDRLTVLKQKQQMITEKLSQWLSEYFHKEYLPGDVSESGGAWSPTSLERQLPDIKMIEESIYTAKKKADPEELFGYFSKHPSIAALDKNIEASEMGVELARQKYRPEYGVSASYAFRDDDQSGNKRADFVSVGLTFDLPLFTKNRQDKDVLAAVSQAEAVKTKKWLLVREMIADFENARSQLMKLNERQHLYRSVLLPQMHEQAEASLSAYTSDDGDFAEVVRARIAELNAQIDALGIDVDRQKTLIMLNYYFMTTPDDIVASARRTGDTQ